MAPPRPRYDLYKARGRCDRCNRTYVRRQVHTPPSKAPGSCWTCPGTTRWKTVSWGDYIRLMLTGARLETDPGDRVSP